MKQKNRPRLPKGLRWHSRSPYIWFSWRDARGRQHQQSTEETAPEKALLFKIQFLEERKEESLDETIEDLGRLPLKEVADKYFNWKLASSCTESVERELRLFKNVIKFFGSCKAVRSIKLQNIRKYQEERRQQVSPTMKKQVTARTVNYEAQLLRSVMSYADCWTDNFQARYKPLRQVKNRIGKAATNEQLKIVLLKASTKDTWQLAMHCAAVAVGSGCRGGEIRKLQLQDVRLQDGKLIIGAGIAKTRIPREPRLMAIAEWGLRQLLLRAQCLGATEPHHYLLPLSIHRSRKLPKTGGAQWDVNRPMTGWVRSWRSLMKECGMEGFRFHDLRHTFRTLGAQTGIPIEVMMAQLGHMDRETSMAYVHIQQRALEHAKQLLETELNEVLATVQKTQPPEATSIGSIPSID